jgi:hypothetical protein
METKDLIQQIETTLKSVLPTSIFINVVEYKQFFGGNCIGIMLAIKDYNINGVNGQRPQAVSLSLDPKTLELQPQIFGGNGGQSIYRQPNRELREEKYLYMQSVKIPFRKPKPEIDNVLKAIKTFAENYIKILKENKDVLMYKEYVDYDSILK